MRMFPWRRKHRLPIFGFVVAVLLPSLLLPSAAAAGALNTAAGRSCTWWYGIGDSPTPADIDFAALHYDVVVLNAWETGALRQLRQLNPSAKALVYKDLSSTRNYPGAVDDGVDAARLPTGLGHQAVQRSHPEWFAVDTAGHRVQWSGYPQHWQMAVWEPGYQTAWADAVTAEVVREGWDGVLADNDFYTLRWYSDVVLAGTRDQADTDRLLRQGLNSMLDVAGQSLARAGKMFVPNISESHVEANRWTTQSRYGAGMDEHFMLRTSDDLLTFQGDAWNEMMSRARTGTSWLLLLTHAQTAQQRRVGYAASALLSSSRTCWSTSSTSDYRDPNWSQYQDLKLGAPRGAAVRESSGVWTRRFAAGWVAVNPTNAAVAVQPPAAMATIDGHRAQGTLRVGAFDAAVLVP